MRTRVKICGITRVDDAAAAVRAGADAIGLVFDRRSPRFVVPEQAAAIVQSLAPFVTAVGLFVNAEPWFVREALQQVPVHLLQFHGDETPEQCRSYDLPYIKAIRMRENVDLHERSRVYGDAAALLLDTFDPDVAGGSGKRFDWTRVPTDLPRPIVLAGGLTADTVAEAIRSVRPYAVDVSSGVEASKGIKDAKKVEAFISAARSAA
ncbi:MAG TPA: phosphoribosylanthranilate isomerase [Burkholderiales bacterium]|nr:phosphoribosylanthranilate isomerase [Burkholderiales bacterium]